MNRIRRVLVIGGAGYIGSHVTRQLVASNYQVSVLDNLSTGNRMNIGNDVQFYRGDCRDRYKLRSVFRNANIDAVVYLAAKVVVSESVLDPDLYWRHNFVGLLETLQEMKRANVRNIVFASSAAVYGKQQHFGFGYKESDPTVPITPYGKTKLACEWLLQDVSKISCTNYVIFRFFNVAGQDPSIPRPLAKKPITHLMPNAAKATIEKKDVIVFGDGRDVRDYIHVSDVARAHLPALRFLSHDCCGIFNLGTQIGTSTWEVLSEFEYVSNMKVSHHQTAKRRGDPPISVANTKEMREVLGFNPAGDLRTIIKSELAVASRNNRR